MTNYIITLSPDSEATERIERLKERVRSVVGEQQYLDDEPHVTLYVGDLDGRPGTDIELPRPPGRSFTATGWEIFRNDAVTGNHTLACRLEAAGLCEFQQCVAAAVQEYRCRQTIDRFDQVREEFDPQRRENLREYGFPFIGSGWIPHLTVASVDPDDFDTAWSELRTEPLDGEYQFESIAVYELVDGTMSDKMELSL